MPIVHNDKDGQNLQAMQNLITKSFFQPQDEDALVLYANNKV